MSQSLNTDLLLFRAFMKDHINNLLSMQRAYWKQRYTQRVVQFGDENTRFFHTMASGRYRKNNICQIMNETGRMVTDHQARKKSALFYQEFKNRLRTSVDISMQFNLQDLIPPCDVMNLTIISLHAFQQWGKRLQNSWDIQWQCPQARFDESVVMRCWWFQYSSDKACLSS